MEQVTDEELERSADQKQDNGQEAPSTNPDDGTDETTEEAPEEEAAVKAKPPPKLSPEQMLIASLRAMVLDREEKLKSYITAYKQAMADVDREKERLAALEPAVMVPAALRSWLRVSTWSPVNSLLSWRRWGLLG